MQVLGIFNMKGGVGKTATAVNLAYIAASQGKRTLIWDLDPQGASSFYFRIKPKIKGGSEKLLKGKGALESRIKATDFDNLDLIPADFSNRELDLRLAEEKQSRLKKLVGGLSDDYDLMIFDCPPSMSELSEQIFRACNLLLVPMIPTTLSLRTLEQLRSFLKKEHLDGLKLRTFYSMVDRRKKMHVETLEDKDLTGKIGLDTFVSYASAVERMGTERKPVMAFSPYSLPTLQYLKLWDEVKQVLFREKSD